MRSGFIGGIALLVSCSGPVEEKITPTNNPGDPIPDNTGGDSGLDGPIYFEPAYLNVVGEFGWDSTTRSLIDVQTSTGTAYSHILLEYGDSDWAADNFSPSSVHHCFVEIPFTQSAPAPWLAASSSYWMGFDYIPADGLYTNCNLGDGVYDFDPLVWSDDPIAPIASFGWGMGVSEIQPALAEPYAGDDLEDKVFGGVVPNSMLPYGEEDYIAVARQIDASRTVVIENGGAIYLPSDAIHIGDNIATGWYLLLGSGIWTIGS